MPQTVTRPAIGRLPFPPIPKIDAQTAVRRLEKDAEEAEKLTEEIESSARVREEDRRLQVSM